jgi:hypothetical protein
MNVNEDYGRETTVGEGHKKGYSGEYDQSILYACMKMSE